MKATIKTQGQQFIVKEGDILFVDRYKDTQTGDTVTINDVLFIGEGESAKVGTPLVEGASVSVKILENRRGDKLHIYKKKRRKGYQRKKGHRQEISVIRVESIKG